MWKKERAEKEQREKIKGGIEGSAEGRAGGGKNFKEELKGGMMEGNAEVWKKGRVDKNKKKYG